MNKRVRNMTEPVYLDLHIHTSEDADNLNSSYDVDELVKRVLSFNNGATTLLSLTDHNTINKSAYQKLVGKDEKINVLLGVEVHIRNYQEAKPYHAHVFFKADDITAVVDDINRILDELYPKKMVSSNDQIPTLSEIVNKFEKYDFLILPHGGQNHRTFEQSIPKGVNFDNTLERTIYYNQFDGFTSRTKSGTDDTIKYFQKLNIAEFINLVTGSDNYSPQNYPEPKAGRSATEFVPTWMLAEPTFNGLRISLSEKNRLRYHKEKPETPTQFIKSCKLTNDKIDLDVHLTPGLNVVIGESSSGKSLFIDSLFRKIDGDFDGSVYEPLGVSSIKVSNPQGFLPHYINQNFIMDKINNKAINEINIVRRQFPEDDGTKKEVSFKLNELKTIISDLINSIDRQESLESELRNIPAVGKLIYKGIVKTNPISPFLIDAETDEKTILSKSDYERYIMVLDQIKDLKETNLFMDDVTAEVGRIKFALLKAYEKTELKNHVKTLAETHHGQCEERISDSSGESAVIQSQKEKLFDTIRKYIRAKEDFRASLDKLLKFDYKIDTKTIKKGGNTLFIENEFKITEDKILEAIGKFLKTKTLGNKLADLQANQLYKKNWADKRKIKGYKELTEKIYAEFSGMNNEKYRIITKNDKDFDSLSPGWKTAVILDLIFANTSDNAPLIIDQPEDNLASTYLNGDLIDSIHKTKQKRQVIIVSHIATIPMLGDAQNVIVCQNKDGKIIIRNAPLEGTIGNRDIVDIVARLTDGGKSSIKKRFKKYNLKKYRGDGDED